MSGIMLVGKAKQIAHVKKRQSGYHQPDNARQHAKAVTDQRQTFKHPARQ
jgi:hypothetical protein